MAVSLTEQAAATYYFERKALGMAWGAENASSKALNGETRARRETANVKADVRSGELSPAEGAAIVAKIRRRS